MGPTFFKCFLFSQVIKANIAAANIYVEQLIKQQAFVLLIH